MNTEAKLTHKYLPVYSFETEAEGNRRGQGWLAGPGCPYSSLRLAGHAARNARAGRM